MRALNIIILIVASIILVLDQGSKILATSLLNYNVSYDVIRNFFYLTLNKNYGAAFGILSGSNNILVVISVGAIIIISRYIKNFKKNVRNNIAFGLLLGGITGNLIDRIFMGYVRDFLDVKIFNYNFPIFNIADAAVVIGTFLLIISIFKGEDINENNRTK